MAESFCIMLAGIKIKITAQHGTAKEFCRDSLVPDGDAAFAVAADPARVQADMKEVPGVGEATAETLTLYREIAERLPFYGACVFHGASVCYGGKGYLFTAQSGTGKSTHIKLWRIHIGAGVEIINGDKPILLLKDGKVEVCGTPWAGKENWQRNCRYPLSGLCLVTRGKENSIRKVNAGEYLNFLFNQIYLPKNGEARLKTLEILDTLCRTVPTYLLACNMEPEAAYTSFEAMTGEKAPR